MNTDYILASHKEVGVVLLLDLELRLIVCVATEYNYCYHPFQPEDVLRSD